MLQTHGISGYSRFSNSARETLKISNLHHDIIILTLTIIIVNAHRLYPAAILILISHALQSTHHSNNHCNNTSVHCPCPLPQYSDTVHCPCPLPQYSDICALSLPPPSIFRHCALSLPPLPIFKHCTFGHLTGANL